MRRLFTRRLPVFLLWAALPACNCGTGPIQNTYGVLVLPKAELDFHKICIGSTVTLNFAINDESRTALTIEKIDISSDAFKLDPTLKLPKVIPPEGNLQVPISFTPSQGGDFAATITVTSNAKSNAVQMATLLGSGFTGEPKKFDVTCLCDRSDPSNTACGLTSGGMADDPCSLLTYENVTNGASLSRTVTLENQGCDSLTFNAQLYNDDGNPQDDSQTSLFSLGTSSPITIQGGQSQTLTVTFNPPAGMNALGPDIRLKVQTDAPNTVGTNASPGLDDIGLIANSVAPALSVTPTSLAFFSTPEGQTGMQTFTISNTGGSALQVGALTLKNIHPATTDFALQDPSGFTLGPTGQGNDTRVETVTFKPTSTNAHQARIYIPGPGLTTMPPDTTPCSSVAPPMMPCVDLFGGVVPVLTVTWSNDGGMTWNPPPIDFGMTATGAKGLTVMVQLQNTGLANLNVTAATAKDISNMNPSGSYAVMGFTPGMLMPSQTMKFEVVFNDDIHINDDAGKLDITSNDAVDLVNDNGVRSIDLRSTNMANFPPVADATGPGSVAMPCAMLQLDGSKTMDPEGDPITYQWNILKQPPGSQISFATPTQPQTLVVSPNCMGPDMSGTYEFTLTASDQYPGNSNTSAPVTVTVQ